MVRQLRVRVARAVVMSLKTTVPVAVPAPGLFARTAAVNVRSKTTEHAPAIALDRNFAPAMVQLGLTLIALGQPEAALPNFEKGIRLDPHGESIWIFYFGVGECHLLLGHADEAIKALADI